MNTQLFFVELTKVCLQPYQIALVIKALLLPKQNIRVEFFDSSIKSYSFDSRSSALRAMHNRLGIKNNILIAPAFVLFFKTFKMRCHTTGMRLMVGGGGNYVIST